MDILAAAVASATAVKPGTKNQEPTLTTEMTEDNPVVSRENGDAVLSSEDSAAPAPPKEITPIPSVVIKSATTDSNKVEEEEEDESVMKDAEHEDDTATHGTVEEEATVEEESKNSLSGDGAKPKIVKAKKTTTKRRKKNKKPSNYPKRPLSAYNIFFKDTREKIITDHGKTNFQDMVRLIAARWKKATKEEKKKYEEMAAKDLGRYKGEVAVYEKEVAEKKRVETEKQTEIDRKRRETERMYLEAQQNRNVESGSGIRHATEADHRFGFNKGGFNQEAMVAAMGGHMAGGGDSRQLEMARLRLEQDLRGLEEARVLRLRQLEMAQMQGGASGGLRGLGGAGMFGGSGLGELEMELQRRMMAGGGDHLAMANELELRQRLSMLRNPNEQTMEEQEKLLRENVYGAALGATGLGRFGGFGGMGGQGMGMGNPYEEILLREQMLRREREALLLGGGGAASLYGGGALGSGTGLGIFGLGSASSGLFGGANTAIANADMHTNAAAAGLASLRAQTGYVPGSHLERLSDEELRALSSNGRGTSAFKRFGGEVANGEEKAHG